MTERHPDIDSEARRLWDFAVALYDMEGVKQACLSVQARYGLSISTLLGAIWAGAEGQGRLGATDLEIAIRRAVEWHREIIEPMRALRRRLRQHPPAGLEESTERLRRQVPAQELEAERIEQRLFLEDLPGGLAASPERERWRDATSNAALYARKSCPRPDAEVLQSLGLILQQAFPGVSREALEEEAGAAWRLR